MQLTVRFHPSFTEAYLICQELTKVLPAEDTVVINYDADEKTEYGKVFLLGNDGSPQCYLTLATFSPKTR